MKLPEVARPTLTADIEGISGTLVYKPFRIADKRNLLSALSFRDPRMFINTVVDIVRENSNLEELNGMQMHFIEAAFMKIFSASQGGVIEAEYTCSAEVEEGSETRVCGHVTPVRIPIDDIRIDYGNLTPGKSHTIKLNDEIAVVMAAPQWDEIKGYLDENSTINVNDKYVLSCVQEVHSPEGVATREDFDDEELKAWIESLDSSLSDKFAEFFTNTPVIAKSLEVTCPKCGASRLLALRGIDDFFV